MPHYLDPLSYHAQGRPGKIEVVPSKPVDTQHDLSLAYTPGVDILTADDPHEFASACLRILMDNEYADELALKARATALDNYRWDKNREKIRQIYRI